MKEILQQAREEHTAVSVYSNRDDMDRFMVGYVLGVSDEELLLALISPAGKYDGYALIKLNQIYRVNELGEYEQKIERLYESEESKHAFFPVDESNLTGSLLAFSKLKGYISLIELLDGEDSVQGFYDDKSGNVISVFSVTDYGERDGKSFFNANEITRIFCDTADEQTVKRLLMLE